MKYKKHQNKGFTLIELLVVIAIISLLSSVIISSLNNARKKARDVKRVSAIKQVDIAMQFYFDKYGHYPDSTSNPIVPDTGSPWTLTQIGKGGVIDQILINENFMSSAPVDPVNDATHYYYYDRTHTCQNQVGNPAVLVVYNMETSKYNNCGTVCGNTWTGDYCIVYADKYTN